MEDNSLKHDEDINKYMNLKKFGFYLFSPVLVPMNICFSTLFMTVLVVYKSLLDPFVYNYREFWKKRKEYGIVDLIQCTLKACMWMIGRAIISPFVLVYLWVTVAVSSISYLGRVGNYVISNAPSIAAVSTFKPFTDKDTSVTEESFWLPQQANNNEHLNSGFSAILGYMFGLDRFVPSIAKNYDTYDAYNVIDSPRKHSRWWPFVVLMKFIGLFTVSGMGSKSHSFINKGKGQENLREIPMFEVRARREDPMFEAVNVNMMIT